MKRNPIGSILQNVGKSLISGALLEWMDDHREELLQFVRTAQEERGAELLKDLCRRVPLAAGVVELLMGQSPETAIETIGTYDEKLAKELRGLVPNFERLQRAYKRGQQASDSWE